MTIANKAERRGAPRAPRLGTALAQGSRWWTHEYDVEDLSAGGALLTGGPPLRMGRTVGLTLRLGGALPLWVEARVLRRLPSPQRGVAVAFVRLEPAVEDLIHDVVLAALSGRTLRTCPLDGATLWEPVDSPVHDWLA